MRGLGNAARQASAAAQASKSGLAGMAAGLNQLQQAAQRYKQVQDALKQSMSDLSKAQQAVTSAKAKFDADTAAVEKLKAQLKSLRDAQSRLGVTKSTGNAVLRQLRQDLQGLKRDYDIAKKAGDALKMSQLASQIKTAQSAFQTQQEAVRKAAQAYKELSDKVKQTKADLQAAQAAQNASSKGLSSANSDAARLAASYQRQQAALRSLTASLSAAGFNVSGFAASESRLAGDIDRVNSALRQQQALTNAQNQSARASQDMFNSYNNFQGALQTAQQVAAPFQAAAENAMNFEYAMSKVKSLTQMRNIRSGDLERVRTEMAALTEQAEMLGATTEFTSQEVAEAMGFYGMAGWDTKRIQNAMQSTIDLATIAGDHNIQRMADVLSDDMTAMGLKAGEMLTLQTGKQVESSKYFADAFAYALTNANVNRESLHEALKYNAPIAKQWGLTMGEEFAVNMMSANAGIKGSMAGTGLRAGLLRISAPPKKAAAAFAEMGLSMSDAQKELAEGQAAMKAYGVTIGDFRTTLTSLSDVYNKLDRGERLGFVDAVFGKNASSFWANILDKGNVADVLKAAGEIDTGYAEGWAAETASVMRDNTKTSVELLKSSIDALQRSVGEALTPAIRAAADAFSPMVTAAGEFIAQNPAIVQGAAAIAAALATIVVGAAAVKLAFAGWTFITSTVTLVQTALATLGSGAMLGGVIARVTALRTALFGLGGAATFGGWSAMFASVSTAAATAATSIRAFFASLTLGSMASGIAATLSSIGTAIRGAAMAAMSFAFSPVGVALMALALAGLYCYQNWDKVAPVLSNIANILTGALNGAIQTVQPAIQGLMAAFEQLGSSGALQAAVSTIGQTVVSGIAMAVTAIAGILATVISAGAQIVATITNVVTGIVNVISNVLSGNWSAAWEAMKSTAVSAFEGIGNVAKSILDGILNTVNAIKTAWNFISGDTTVARENALKQAPSSAPTDTVMPTAQQQQPPIDTSQTQAALDQVGNSAQNAATNLQGVDQASMGVQTLSTNAQTAATGVQTFGTASQTASTGVQQLSTNATTAGAGVQQLGANAQAAGGGITSLADAASGATGGVSALGSAASGAAGSVSGLGAAVQAACAQLASAGANAAAAVANAAPKANYRGGIYKKGAFLTTFAEKSPEAAIPLDRSQRAIDLWTQTGQILGQLPGKGGVNYEQARKFEDAIKEYNKNPGDFGTLNKTLDTHAEIFGSGGSRGGQARYGGQSRRRAQMQRLPQSAQSSQTLPQPQGEMSEEVRKKVANLDRLIKAADYLPDTESNRRGKADLIRMREEYLRQQGYGGGRMSTVPQPQPSTARRSAYVARSRQSQVPMITAPPFNPDRPGYSRTGMPTNELLKYLPPQKSRLPDLPLMTPPFAPTNQRGALEGLSSGLGLGRQMSFGSSGSPTFTINVTVNGNANADDVKRGVEQAIPQLESFARQLDMFKHEAARRSFD